MAKTQSDDLVAIWERVDDNRADPDRQQEIEEMAKRSYEEWFKKRAAHQTVKTKKE